MFIRGWLLFNCVFPTFLFTSFLSTYLSLTLNLMVHLVGLGVIHDSWIHFCDAGYILIMLLTHASYQQVLA